MLQTGKHICKVTAPFNGWFCESSTGTKGIRIPLEITSGPCAGEECEYIAWISHAAIPGSMKTLKNAFGFNGDLRLLSAISDGPFVGKECEIVCDKETWKDKETVRVKYLNRVGGGGPNTLKKEDADAFIAKFAAECMAAAKKEDASNEPKPLPPVTPDLAADEIPF